MKQTRIITPSTTKTNGLIKSPITKHTPPQKFLTVTKPKKSHKRLNAIKEVIIQSSKNLSYK